jgi:hypothetical protein
MKNIWKKIVVVLALLGASSLSSARGAVSVYAEETEPSSNAVVATAGTDADTNATATTTHRKKRSSSDDGDASVRIDDTGVHIGGRNPVDINAPKGMFDRSSLENDKMGFFKVVVAMITTFGMPVAMIAIIFYFKYRRNKLAHETLRVMIEKGVPMTPELIAEVRGGYRASLGRQNGNSRGGLLPGLILSGIGVALLITNYKHSTGGWIVLFIGVALLIVWFIERKNPNNVQPPR